MKELDERIATLTAEKERLLAEAMAASQDPKIRLLADREIQINFISAKTNLTEIYGKGQGVTPEFEKN